MSNTDGVARWCQLPNEAFVPAWTAIKLAEGVHERLLAQALLSFTVRQKLPFEVAPLHGLIVLTDQAGPANDARSGPREPGHEASSTHYARGILHQVPMTGADIPCYDQYPGKGFTRVQVKGGLVRDFVPVQRDAWQVLDECLDARKDDAPPPFYHAHRRTPFPPRSSGALPLRRMRVFFEEEQIDVSPHVLRLSFCKVKTGSKQP